MSAYRLAHLTPTQMAALERLENDIHVTLVAYEPADGSGGGAAAPGMETDTDDGSLEALLNTYQSGLPNG